MIWARDLSEYSGDDVVIQKCIVCGKPVDRPGRRTCSPACLAAFRSSMTAANNVARRKKLRSDDPDIDEHIARAQAGWSNAWPVASYDYDDVYGNMISI